MYFLIFRIPTFGGKLFEPTTINSDGELNYFTIKNSMEYGMTLKKDFGNEQFWKSVLPLQPIQFKPHEQRCYEEKEDL